MLASSRSIVVKVPLAQISDRTSFHDLFARLLSFPVTYGANMDEWVGLVSSVDSPDTTTIRVGKKGTLTLALQDADLFRMEYPDLWEDLIDSAGTVNFRRVVSGRPSVLALAYQ